MTGIDPFLADIRRRLAARPSFAEMGIDGARAAVKAGRALLGEGPAMHGSEAVDLSTRNGAVKALLHRPVEVPTGLIVYLHGGGWVMGAPEDFEVVVKSLAYASGCAVLVPDYRLAPEHPFPAALHDVVDVIEAASKSILSPAGLAGPLVVMGDSAGANLATVALRHLRGRVAVDLQVLAYPITDCDFGRESYTREGDMPPLRRSDMEWFFSLYAPRDAWHSPDISPLRASDLSGMPPTLLMVAGMDVLHDEGVDYARRLREFGVPVSLRVCERATHGFLPFANHVELARIEIAAVASAVLQVVNQGAAMFESRAEFKGRTVDKDHITDMV